MEEVERDFIEEQIKSNCESDDAFRSEWAVRSLIRSLVQRRIELELSQQEVAKRMGIARSRVAEIEIEGSKTSVSRILAYANAVGMELNATKVAEPRASYSGRGRRPGSRQVR